MASQQSTEMFSGFFEAMAASRADAVASCLAGDVRWWFPESAAQSGAVPRRAEGRDDVLAIVGHGAAHFERLSYAIEHVVEDGDMVAVHARATGETRVGKSYDNEYNFLFRTRDGLIVEAWEFLDTAYAFSRMA